MQISALGNGVILHHGDNRDALKSLPDNSIDSVVTDPPYELAFMGKKWDNLGIAFDPAFWAEVLRVLKPGGHIAAFGASRGYHRMACAIEDAGFEIRDSLMWIYGVGFPKNHRVSRSPMFCQCGEAGHNGDDIDLGHLPPDRSDTALDESDDASPSPSAHHSTDKVLSLKGDYLRDCGSCDEPLRPDAESGQVSFPSQRDALAHNHSSGCGDVLLRESSHSLSPAQYSDRLSSQDCSDHESSSNAKRDCIRASMLPADICELDSGKRGSDQGLSSIGYGNGFPVCQACGKPNADGFGTSLKPAFEPIVLARKPLSEKTVAANVLRWGTGAINVDGCRVGTDGGTIYGGKREGANDRTVTAYGNGLNAKTAIAVEGLGRWPANVCHDGSDEVVGMFPASSVTGKRAARSKSAEVAGTNWLLNNHESTEYTDSGSAARFFYSAKASKADRAGSKHPTVKPIALMQWLCRLITPPGGTVLDPFAGSGTTGAAALNEQFNIILCEREAEYVDDIKRRFAPVEMTA